MKTIATIATSIVLCTAAHSADAQQRVTPGVFMEMLGAATAYEEICEDLAIDDSVMQQAGALNNITASVFDDPRNQAMFKGQYQRTLESAASFSDSDFFCEMGLMDYGADGVNIPGLLKEKN